MAPVNIGEASKITGISQKMVRHYESLGLLAHPPRTDSGYRLYDEDSINTLHFIRRARDLGFGIPEIGELLDLWRNRRRSSATVKKMAQTRIDELQQRIDSLATMKRSLEHLVKQCHGDDRSACPILDDMAGQGQSGKKAKKKA
ncbi:MAG: Cu(I)-responsive transcriptional regulator [Burkholderiales bacterium]|nr:Cu(I)-responsive transcriptional regulator [Burkholderiales bacterium]MDE2432271.1 Cu(I)-responsive transcriptional regulator [Burkholderiales bacterium]